MMVECVMCPEGKCSEDCPTLDVLPFDGPLAQENIRKARKLTASGMSIEEVKEKLSKAGGVDAKNKLIDEWIEKYESSEKHPMYYILKNKLNIINQQHLIAEHEKAIDHGKKLLKALTDAVDATTAVYEEAIVNGATVSVVDDESAPVDHANERSLSGLKRKAKMMVECVLCPEGECSRDCPTLDVLPYDGPSVKDNILKAQILTASGMKIEEIKEKLSKAGGVDAKRKLIDEWIEEYDSREKDTLYHIIKKRIIITQQDKILAEQRKVLAEKQNMIKSAKAALKAVRAVYEEAVLNGASVSVVDDASAHPKP